MASTAIVPAARKQQMIGHDRGMTLSEDNALRKQILATDAQDGLPIDIQSLLVIIRDILNLVSPGIDGILNVSLSSLLFTLVSL